jgi:hypothetical protein
MQQEGGSRVFPPRLVYFRVSRNAISSAGWFLVD